MNRRGFLKAMGAIAAGVGLRAVPVLGQQYSELVVPKSFVAAVPAQEHANVLDAIFRGRSQVAATALLRPEGAIRTTAEWIPVTNRILSEPSALRGLINQRLLLSLDLEIDQRLYGLPGDVEYVRESEWVA